MISELVQLRLMHSILYSKVNIIFVEYFTNVFNFFTLVTQHISNLEEKDGDLALIAIK